MSGRRVLAVVSAIVLATVVLPPAAAFAVNRRRVDRAHVDLTAIAGQLRSRPGELIRQSRVGVVLCGSGQFPVGSSAQARDWAHASRASLPALTDAPTTRPDPWGNCYLADLTEIARGGGAFVVLSAGPNGVIETALESGASSSGDDIVVTSSLDSR